MTNHPLRGTFVGNAIVRLADEGVPIGALSRTFKIPYDSARGFIQLAVEMGILAEMPAEDWPAGTRRLTRSPTISPIRLIDRPWFQMELKQAFSLTPGQARVLHCLLQAKACTRAHLQMSVSPDSDPKIIDVWVCLIRQKLRPFQIDIKTVYGQGYLMTDENKRRLLDFLSPPEVCPENQPKEDIAA